MPIKKVEKTGVYRAKNGHAVYLQEGQPIADTVLDNYEFDGAGTKDFAMQPESSYFGGIQDAPQNQKAEDTWSGRMVKGAPENKAMKAPGDTKSDAALADDAAKDKKS